ncbi:MAG: hypothetical protein A2139_14890 [Desulfobacca sp. RBG_16_60_12]|nr:MAG: hypothetical protein A2139_14890 [Desulfobacca sp. RBG_16_60_12]
MSHKVLIADGMSIALRHFCANPSCDENGNPVGAILGTIRMLKYLLAETQADRVFFAWDGKGGSQRRRGTLAEYKAGRKPRLNRTIEETTGDSKQNLAWQLDRLKMLLGHLGVSQLELPNIEADDTIGYLVGLLDPTAKVVVSGDRDMWQLVSETTAVYWPNKKVYITKGTFVEHSPILPENFVLYRALSGKGDASDNIHGIKGLGEKTLLKLFPELGTHPITLDQLIGKVQAALELDQTGITKLGNTQKRWYQTVLDSRELVMGNVAISQLTSPEISATAASIIKSVAQTPPQFNITGFKLALMNSALQITDQDLFPTFRAFQLRALSTT